MDSNHDIVPTLRMFDGLMMNKAADEIEALRAQVATLERIRRGDPPAVVEALRALPAIHCDEIDGEESDGTPRHWRGRPFVSLRKVERIVSAALATPQQAQPERTSTVPLTPEEIAILGDGDEDLARWTKGYQEGRQDERKLQAQERGEPAIHIVADRSIPPGEAHVLQGDQTVARITNIGGTAETGASEPTFTHAGSTGEADQWPEENGVRYCLACAKLGHRTDECHSTQALNDPAARELARLSQRSHDLAALAARPAAESAGAEAAKLVQDLVSAALDEQYGGEEANDRFLAAKCAVLRAIIRPAGAEAVDAGKGQNQS